MEAEIRSIVRQIIGDGIPIEHDTRLSQICDSLDIVEIVTEIEERYDFAVTDEQIRAMKDMTCERLVRWVKERVK